MATVKAKILKTELRVKKTNKGNFYFLVHHIDKSIYANDTLQISWQMDDPLTDLYSKPTSLLCSRGISTEFKSVDGVIEGSILSSGKYELSISGDRYVTNVAPESSLRTHWAMTPHIFYAKNDKYTYNTGFYITEDSTEIDVNILNTESKLGLFESNIYRTTSGGLSFTISSISITSAKNLVESSDIASTDPYEYGGTSASGGGSGSFDSTGDNIDIPDLPTYSAVDTGFISIFNPSISQLKNLANYMWSNDLFNLDTWKKIFDNPMDAILGLSIVPVAVPEGGTADVTVGNIITTVSMTKASNQYVKVDCGSINVSEYWGGYMDYAPYTKAELYLPYCGTHPINIDDIMGKTVQVVYHVDILSGACVAYVKCGTSVLYSFVGQCSSSIPITAGDMTSVINGILSISASVGTMVATGGMSAPITALVGTQLATSTASNVMNMKPHVEKSGSMSGTGGMLGIQTPYLIITRPRQCLPANQNTFTGYPSYITSQLSSLSGFTTVDSVHLSNMSCTDEEKKEIENMLIQGVIL